MIEYLRMKILKEPKEGIYIEKKSKFICHLATVSSFEEASDFVASEKKKYYDAKHHCFAIILGRNGEQMRSSDDGEPSGTAGRPMLEVLRHENLTNVVCCVTRYFGGTLLGTGGLVRAYTESLKDALNQSTFSEETEADIYNVTCLYSDETKILNFLRDNDFRLLDKEYSDKVKISFAVTFDSDVNVKEKILDATNGTAFFDEILHETIII